jgi:hypothetical protein
VVVVGVVVAGVAVVVVVAGSVVVVGGNVVVEVDGAAAVAVVLTSVVEVAPDTAVAALDIASAPIPATVSRIRRRRRSRPRAAVGDTTALLPTMTTSFGSERERACSPIERDRGAFAQSRSPPRARTFVTACDGDRPGTPGPWPHPSLHALAGHRRAIVRSHVRLSERTPDHPRR